ncbi:hypothetical protein BV22DRAFT_991388, partial [Leucogyrophana mollusca]
SVRKLKHGAALYELESVATAKWLNQPANRRGFLEHFGADSIIRDRTFQVIVEYVPTTFDPDSGATIAEVEKNSGLEAGSISKARYVKPLNRRRPGQRTAHAILTFKSREDANHAIEQGLSIEGRKVYARKLLPEPTRCLKCQSLAGDHVAADCPQEQDTCGTCGAEHRTASCGITDVDLYYCANCKDHCGHASWSRECPVFIERFRRHQARSEDVQYRYYPTNDPKTW